ncbi:hypothetical protein GR28A_00016 [Vibrio phage vB_VcorM_GR28A]|nr:hypothetical protein GR28A_00016 [Vibrio phage vB_VcorM_GR28A]
MFAEITEAGYTVHKSSSMGSQEIHHVFKQGRQEPVATVLLQGKKKKFIKAIRARINGGAMPCANLKTLLNTLGEHGL